jgi:hypothetical protein
LKFLEESREDTFILGDPQSTYDNRVHIEGRINEWTDEAEALTSVEAFITEAQDIGKHQRDYTDGIPSINQTPPNS